MANKGIMCRSTMGQDMSFGLKQTVGISGHCSEAQSRTKWKAVEDSERLVVRAVASHGRYEFFLFLISRLDRPGRINYLRNYLVQFKFIDLVNYCIGHMLHCTSRFRLKYIYPTIYYMIIK